MVTRELQHTRTHTHIPCKTQTHNNITCVNALVRVTYRGYPRRERSRTYVQRLERTQQSHQLTPLIHINNVREEKGKMIEGEEIKLAYH